MKSTIPCGVVLFHLVLLIWLTPVQGKGMLANLMTQAETLQHGLDLASKVGDIGSQRFDVAFTVVTSRSTTYSSSGSTIAFNTVKTNYGNGFNIGNSRFTAPTAGLYFFSWSLAIHGCYNGQSRLVKNGMTYHQVNCRSTFQQCGATVSMALNRGDQVWVVTASSSVYVYAPYSFFSGWKIN